MARQLFAKCVINRVEHHRLGSFEAFLGARSSLEQLIFSKPFQNVISIRISNFDHMVILGMHKGVVEYD